MIGHVTFRIDGLSSLLMNNPASMIRRAPGPDPPPKIPPAEKEAAAKVYRDDQGRLYLPAIAFRSSIIGRGGGASGRRMGKFTANSRVAAGVFIVDDRAMLFDPKTGKPITDYEIDTRRAVVQGNGVQRSRPKVREWACDLVLELDDDFITVDQALELLNISGRVAGVGDFRPQCKGMFGRYKAEIKER